MCVIASATGFDWSALGGNALAIVMAIVGLGFIIFVHELGHFAVAKWCGVKCDKFYVGFDVPLGRFVNWLLRREGEFKLFGMGLPRTIGRPVQWGETEYGIGILPLGGYVKMLGQNDDPRMTEEQIRESAAADDTTETKEIVGPEGETYRVDSRSYIAKSVPQRMAIISAGVIMNVIFAFVFAVIAFRIGVPSMPGIVGAIDPGMPAWEAGLQADDKIERIGDIQNPWFEQLTNEVVLSGRGDAVEVEVSGHDKPLLLKPTRARRAIAQIGVGPPISLQLGEKDLASPFGPAASVASDFPAGATIVAIDGEPVKTYGQLTSKLVTHQTEPIEYTLEKQGEKTKVTVPANHREYVGLVMPLGPITAVQTGSPAAAAGLKPGDQIIAINDRSIGMNSEGELGWDPRTLASELAKLGAAGETATFQIVRAGNKLEEGDAETIAIPLRPVTWLEMPLGEKSPLPLPALGATCVVLNQVEGILFESPAAAADIQPGDVIQSARIVVPEEFEDKFKGLDEAIEFTAEKHPWPIVMEQVQDTPPGAKLELKLQREGADKPIKVELLIATAEDQFDPRRGLALKYIFEDRFGETFSEQCSLAWMETKRSLTSVYRFLRRIVNNDIPATALGGPITIARAGFLSALDGPGRLLLFMTLISANLAVVNFLPIPVLDGGHMLFLAYEGIFRRPPPAAVVDIMSLAGLALILCLMLFVFGLDLGFIDRNL